jgi:ribosomal protein S2
VTGAFPFDRRQSYIQAVRTVRKSKKDYTWEIRRLKASPAALVAVVDTPDETSAIKEAIKQFNVQPEDQKRLIALRRQ